jgi:hypothetical protein
MADETDVDTPTVDDIKAALLGVAMMKAITPMVATMEIAQRKTIIAEAVVGWLRLGDLSRNGPGHLEALRKALEDPKRNWSRFNDGKRIWDK